MLRTAYEERVGDARAIEGRIVSGEDTCVPRWKFHAVCKVLWPDKTAAHLASIGGRDERTAKRWLAGEYEPPFTVLLAVIQEMFKR